MIWPSLFKNYFYVERFNYYDSVMSGNEKVEGPRELRQFNMSLQWESRSGRDWEDLTLERQR